MSAFSYKPSPFVHAKIFSRFFHSWISSLIAKSHEQGTLYLNDLYQLPKSLESMTLTNKLEANWFDEIKRCPGNPSLIRATLRTIGWRPFLLGFLLLLNGLLRVAQPLLLILFMNFFEPCSTMSPLHAWILATCTMVVTLLSAIIFERYLYWILICGMQMRIAYNGLLFRKMLRLSSQTMNHLSSGQITNLMANDAYKVELVHYFFNHLWVAPLQIIMVVFLFWSFVKYITLIAIGYTLFLLFIQPIFSRCFVHLRTKLLKITDERVKIMSEIIKSMRIVKMYCWESAFEQKIRDIRKREIIQTGLFMMSFSSQMILTHTYTGTMFLLMYGTMWTFDIKFDTRFFAIASCMLAFMQVSVLLSFALGIRDVAQYLTAQRRIKAFLLFNESQRDNRLTSSSILQLSGNQDQTKTDNTTKPTSNIICDLKRARWEQTGTFSLKNIVFEAHPGDLICIIGPVGSGKSSLLQTLTGEISCFEGKVRLYGSFCYVPQEPWIFSSTIKENILFDRRYNHKLFQRVIKVTALDTDFLQLPQGANTVVGDQGVTLSGGQKARVNMARALYQDANIYLLDDPLSAVDVKISKHLFDKSIKMYLREKICVLVTHQIQFLRDATEIIVLNNGEMVQKGTYPDLLSSSASFARLLEDINQHQQEQQSSSLSKQPSKADFINMEKEDGEEMESSPIDIESKQEGVVKWSVYVSYIRAGVGLILGLILTITIHSAQQATNLYSNWWLAQWSNYESHRNRIDGNCTNALDPKINQIRSMSDSEWNDYRNQRFYTYGVIVLVFIILSSCRIFIAQGILLNAARVLHNKMFQRLIRAPILFFDTNPVGMDLMSLVSNGSLITLFSDIIGRILNRFTRDIALIDEALPSSISDFVQCLFEVLSAVVLIGILNPWAFLPALFTASTMLFLRNRFVRCLRDLKRIEGNTRSPLYSQLISTINGLKVIRSYHAEKMCSDEFLRQLDDNTRVHYLITTVNTWGAIRFDALTFIFIALATLLAMFARISGQHFSAADIVLTLSYSLNLMGLFQWTVRQSVEAETQMTSVERILEYCELEQEPPAQVPPKYRPPSNWPSQGQITFNNVCMSHSKDPQTPLALSHITLTILPHEKIGIVGRTGAGKSSFIQTLFRMGTLVDGEIRIDHIDISTVGLDDLRRRISIIPQDPVLFTGTMRSNLDQFGDYSDAEIWHALEQVQLKKLVSDVLPNGLTSSVSESGSNLSVGQKQLVCLARAILKKSKILVIDEATANVDNATDELIQRSIRDQFRECTVLTVAHRLRTVIDSDRIMVLGNGELLEFDAPDVLLSDPGSQFASLVEQTGAAEAEHLRLLASIACRKVNIHEQSLPNYSDEELPFESEEIDPLVI